MNHRHRIALKIDHRWGLFWIVGIIASYNSAGSQDSNMSDCLTIDINWWKGYIMFNVGNLIQCLFVKWYLLVQYICDLLDCKLHDVARLQLYEKLGGLLENRVSTYSKSKLCEILLYGEKPEMLEKYTHNKFIFLSVQKFIYTVYRYHFVNDPYDLWFSLQNISNFSLQNISVYFCYFISTYPTD